MQGNRSPNVIHCHFRCNIFGLTIMRHYLCGVAVDVIVDHVLSGCELEALECSMLRNEALGVEDKSLFFKLSWEAGALEAGLRNISRRG